jgi:SIR2-like domain
MPQPATVDASSGEFTEHYETVVLNILRGRVTPVLGAGASLYGRAGLAAREQPTWRGGGTVDSRVATSSHWYGAPSAAELADYLAREFKVKEASDDLLQIAQWVYALRGGSGGLYDALHDVFAREFPSTRLHEFLAEVPARLRSAGRGKPPLIVTTNYDDLIERALESRGVPYDLVVYMAEGRHEGLFCHLVSDGELVPIESPETYMAVDPDRQTVVLKMHGFVCREDASDDSYVITEDHYIEYLTRTDLTRLLPKPVMARLLNCHLLFLGYSLRDWNLRAIFHRIWQEERLGWKSWAIRRPLDPLPPELAADPAAPELHRQRELECELEESFWDERGVDIFDVDLARYTDALKQAAIEVAHEPGDR